MPRYSNLDEVFASYDARFRPDKAEGVNEKVQMNLTGDNAQQKVIYVHDGTFELSDGTADDPKLTVTADADDWLAIENGQLNPMMAMMQGKLKLKGSVPFATKFMSFFGGGG